MMTAVTGDGGGSAEQRLFDAVARWNTDTGDGLPELIDAACVALVDGLDSPALRELAGASARDPSWDLRELVAASLAQLRIPYPGTLAPGHRVAVGGGTVRRPGVDSLRLEVAPSGAPTGGGFQVRIHVNGVETTSAGAGLGMDPYDVLVPTNRFVATAEPRTVPVARCRCGVYGCGATDVTLVRDGDLVHWEWSGEVPMGRGVSFAAAGYDAELARVAADHSWETPERTAGRLVLTALAGRPPGHGLTPRWAGNDHRDDRLFAVWFEVDDDYQVFVAVPWHGRSPEELAEAAGAILSRPPAQWPATWHPVRHDLTGPPPFAGPSWQRERLW